MQKLGLIAITNANVASMEKIFEYLSRIIILGIYIEER